MTSKAQIIRAIRDYVYTDRYMGVEQYFTARKIKKDKDKAGDLELLKNTVKACKMCQLYKTRKNIVFGQGDPKARLMFVGEAPGAEEDQQGLAFVGAAGQLLTKIIEAMGLERKDVFIANILKCRPPGNRNPNLDEIEACRGYLDKQIEIIRPKIIVCLGKFSAQTLLETTQPISSLRGKFFDYHGIRLLPTFHPAYLLRNPGDKKLVWQDMKKAMKEL